MVQCSEVTDWRLPIFCPTSTAGFAPSLSREQKSQIGSHDEGAAYHFGLERLHPSLSENADFCKCHVESGEGDAWKLHFV